MGMLTRMMMRYLCCGGTDVVEPSPAHYKDALLSHGGHGLRSLPTSSDGLAGSAEFRDQRLYVMRHGHRQDEEDEVWHVSAGRPWDPPLSAKGREQAKEAGRLFKDKHVDYVLTSPFVRCLQTSSEIVAQLGLAQGRWLATWPMCELCDPRLLLAGREELIPKLGRRPIDEWMWEGRSFGEAIDVFMQDEATRSKVPIRPELWSDSKPTYPERLESALKRYEKGIKSICKEFEGKTVLVVTHGEALRAAVNMFDHRAGVYEVRHTGYVPLHRELEAGSGGKWGPWRMECTSGQTGVMWSY